MTEEPTKKEKEDLVAAATAILVVGIVLVILSSGCFAWHLYHELKKLYS